MTNSKQRGGAGDREQHDHEAHHDAATGEVEVGGAHDHEHGHHAGAGGEGQTPTHDAEKHSSEHKAGGPHTA